MPGPGPGGLRLQHVHRTGHIIDGGGGIRHGTPQTAHVAGEHRGPGRIPCSNPAAIRSLCRMRISSHGTDGDPRRLELRGHVPDTPVMPRTAADAAATWARQRRDPPEPGCRAQSRRHRGWYPWPEDSPALISAFILAMSKPLPSAEPAGSRWPPEPGAVDLGLGLTALRRRGPGRRPRRSGGGGAVPRGIGGRPFGTTSGRGPGTAHLPVTGRTSRNASMATWRAPRRRSPPRRGPEVRVRRELSGGSRA